MRAVEGPAANERGARQETVSYKGTAKPLRDVWIALRVNMRNVLEATTLLADGTGRRSNATTKT
ncbi:MAG: hypothetical protein GIW99_08520 [Candidatus Eremiobacteraeota bacterium]|nr:hypothetical protein [Candidatus Eremiobacteraeota bacterium]MBC5827708.1 hypothetical protein [Candidatus Eremiobacteraeota bacterium]